MKKDFKVGDKVKLVTVYKMKIIELDLDKETALCEWIGSKKEKVSNWIPFFLIYKLAEPDPKLGIAINAWTG